MVFVLPSTFSKYRRGIRPRPWLHDAKDSCVLVKRRILNSRGSCSTVGMSWWFSATHWRAVARSASRLPHWLSAGHAAPAPEPGLPLPRASCLENLPSPSCLHPRDLDSPGMNAPGPGCPAVLNGNSEDHSIRLPVAGVGGCPALSDAPSAPVNIGEGLLSL